MKLTYTKETSVLLYQVSRACITRMHEWGQTLRHKDGSTYRKIEGFISRLNTTPVCWIATNGIPRRETSNSTTCPLLEEIPRARDIDAADHGYSNLQNPRNAGRPVTANRHP